MLFQEREAGLETLSLRHTGRQRIFICLINSKMFAEVPHITLTVVSKSFWLLEQRVL